MHARLARNLVDKLARLRARNVQLKTLQDDYKFREYARAELTKHCAALSRQGFNELISRAVAIVCDLRSRMFASSQQATWMRLMKKGRLMKEINEVLPVAARLLEFVELHPEKKITVVDLCSGVGYLSILLAELLAASPNIERFVLVDSAFPQLNKPVQQHHINPAHILLKNFWPHELVYRKYDLKSSAGHRSLQRHVIDRAPGPVALLAVHLCGVLSIKAAQLYNDHPRAAFLALKPCCLPPLVLAQWQCVWTCGGHSFAAKEVCASGKYNKGKWVGNVPKSSHAGRFKLWCEHLFSCVVVGDDGVKKMQDIKLMPAFGEDGGHLKHYQTLFVFAVRTYIDAEGSVSDIGGEATRKRSKKSKSKRQHAAAKSVTLDAAL